MTSKASVVTALSYSGRPVRPHGLQVPRQLPHAIPERRSVPPRKQHLPERLLPHDPVHPDPRQPPPVPFLYQPSLLTSPLRTLLSISFRLLPSVIVPFPLVPLSPRPPANRPPTPSRWEWVVGWRGGRAHGDRSRFEKYQGTPTYMVWVQGNEEGEERAAPRETTGGRAAPRSPVASKPTTATTRRPLRVETPGALFRSKPAACYRPPRNKRFTAFASNESGSKCPPTQVTI